MATEIATQLITVGATLSGVVLTLVTNAYLEGRRARDARELESLHLASEHAKWLRDERQKAYAGLSLAAEEALQFIRSDMPTLIGPDSTGSPLARTPDRTPKGIQPSRALRRRRSTDCRRARLANRT
jgi:hypothetical protein